MRGSLSLCSCRYGRNGLRQHGRPDGRRRYVVKLESTYIWSFQKSAFCNINANVFFVYRDGQLWRNEHGPLWLFRDGQDER